MKKFGKVGLILEFVFILCVCVFVFRLEQVNVYLNTLFALYLAIVSVRIFVQYSKLVQQDNNWWPLPKEDKK